MTSNPDRILNNLREYFKNNCQMPKKEDKKGQSRSSTVKSQVEQPNTNQ